jgi:Ser/Thr protein kinase RdoA (MazF antagonist)
MSGLREVGLPVGQPVPSDRGEAVVTRVTDVGVFHAAVFRRVPGDERSAADLGPTDFRRWGASLARLHNALEELVASRPPTRPSWEDQLDGAERELGDEAPLRAELDFVRRSLAELPVNREAFGLIHGDFQLDNVFWNGALHVIDFDDCAYHWYAADVVLALDDVLEGGVDLAEAPVPDFVEGYRAERTLDELLLGHLDTFRRAGDLVRYARIRRALDLPPGGDYPNWLCELSDKLRAYATTYERRVASS